MISIQPLMKNCLSISQIQLGICPTNMTLSLELLPRMDHAEYISSDRSKFTHDKLQAFNAKMKIKNGSKYYPNKFAHPCHYPGNDTCHL